MSMTFVWRKRSIQGDEQGYFADKAYQQPGLPRDPRTAGSDRRRGVARPAPSSARRLAEALQFLVVEHPLRRRARSRHDEAMVRHAPRPLSRARPQRLPSSVCRNRHEHEAGARAHRLGPDRNTRPVPRATKPQTRTLCAAPSKMTHAILATPAPTFLPNRTSQQPSNPQNLNCEKLAHSMIFRLSQTKLAFSHPRNNTRSPQSSAGRATSRDYDFARTWVTPAHDSASTAATIKNPRRRGLRRGLAFLPAVGAFMPPSASRRRFHRMFRRVRPSGRAFAAARSAARASPRVLWRAPQKP